MKIEDGYFFNPTKGNLSFNETIKEIFEYMNEMPHKSYEVTVGCDSSSGTEPKFPIAVVVLRKGEGGRFFLKRMRYKEKKFHNWKTRILQEILLSCEVALLFKEKIKKENCQFKYIHADVGSNGKTRDMIKEVTGLIRGNGFEPVIKPGAYAASIVADRFS